MESIVLICFKSISSKFPGWCYGISSITGINWYSTGFAGPVSISGNTATIGFTIHATSMNVTIYAIGH